MGAHPQAFSRFTVVPELGIELLSAQCYGHVFDRHFHDGYAVGLTTSGQQAFNARGARHVGTPGTVIAFAPGEAHDGEAADTDGFAYRMLYLAEPLVREVLAETGGAAPHFPDPLLRDPGLAATVDAAASACAGPGDSLARFAAVSRLIRRLGYVRSAMPEAREPRAVARAREFMHARLGEGITIDLLANAAGIARFPFIRAFTRAHGLPPHAYLLSLRLNEARRLLAAGEMPAAVAAACGFTDQTHLTREFRRRLNITPGAYRAACSRGSIGSSL